MIYRPIKTNRKTQNFGEAKACIKVDDNGNATFPMKVTSKLFNACLPGYVDFYTEYLKNLGHNGEDWATFHGEPLYFSVDLGCQWWARSEADVGVRLDVYSVTRVKIDKLPSQAGKMAHQEWVDNDGYMYVKFMYAHLKDILWATEKVALPGRTYADGKQIEKPIVKYGYQIGWADNTGASSGDHLHMGMKFVYENSMTMDSDNGYNGAVDFNECFEFENKFVGDVIKVKNITAQIETLQLRTIDLLKLLIKKLKEDIANAGRKTIGTLFNKK